MASWQEQVMAAHQEVIDDIKSKFKELNGGPSILEGVKGFYSAVDWTEGWIIALVVLQIGLFVSVVLLKRNSPKFQGIVFFTIMAIIYFSERLNALAMRHWESFSKQNYFDESGVFVAGMVSGPLLLTMFAILLNYLLESSKLLIEMKRKELMYNARARQREEKKDTKKTK